MPDLPAYHDGNANLHSYQYLWMAHWMGKSCNSLIQRYNEDGADSIGQASLTSMNVGCESNSRSEWYPFPLSSYNQNIDSFSTVREEYVTNSLTSGHGMDIVGANITNSPSRLCILASKKLEFSSQDAFSLLGSIKDGPVQCQKSFGSIERESLPSSGPFLCILPGTTSRVVPYKHRPGGTPAESFMLKNKVIKVPFCRVESKDILAHTKLTPFENGTYNSCSYAASWMCDGVKVKDTKSSCFRQKVGALHTDDPSASKLDSLCCIDEQGREVNGSSGAGFSPSCNNPDRVTELEDINPGSYLLQKMPVCSVHDEETLKLCSIGNSVESVPEFRPRISQTTHLCFTKIFGVILSRGHHINRELKLSTEGNAKALYELFSLSSPGRGKQGPKHQSIRNTSNSEGKEDRGDGKKEHPCLQKELSADTDMLDTDHCVTRNSSHGIASFPSTKDFYVGKNSTTACATCSSSGEVGGRKTETLVIPNTCEYTPAIMTARGLTGRTTSRTDSLEFVNLYSRVQPPMDVNPSEEFYVPEAQPNQRLVKRLKLNTCGSLAQGNGTTEGEPASSGRKIDDLFTKIMKYNITSKDLVKNQNESDRSLVLFEKLDFSSMDSVKGHEDLIFSHPWIRRWRHSQPEAQSMKPAARVICEPQIPKPTLKKRKEKLPSFAAMALMGKASNRFRPCEFRKRGSVTVWNTEGF
ncbi:hypothetical protein MKW94_001832 [Papaver nudicaule]|uniref:F-box family protein n=1 Tax=Papaver nudicaule TaxID=74823 RepID=A0AA41W1G8_PAPNU|nr:hypothetical protein [Papaver nudicaule]